MDQDMSGIYIGDAAGKAKKVSVTAPKLTNVPIGDFEDIPLTAANIDNFFTVQKTCGTTDYTTPDIDPDDYAVLSAGDFTSAGWTVDGNSADISGDFANNDPDDLVHDAYGSVRFLRACSIAISLSDGSDATRGTQFNLEVPGEDTSEESSWSGSVSAGTVINFGVNDVEGGSTASFSLSVQDTSISEDPYTPGTAADFSLGDAASGIKLVPGIFGEPLTWCRVTLIAKVALSGCKISAGYHTEDNFDKIDMTVAGESVLDGASGDHEAAEVWSGSLAAGESICIEYQKDESGNADGESDTFFTVKCAPVRVGTVTGYEEKYAASAGTVYVGGSDGKAIKISGGTAE